MKTVELFSGAGGNGFAARAAGLDVIWAANHNPLAVEYYARNHPGVIPMCQDLQQADWAEVPGHDVLIASTCCQGHTKAKGKTGPHHYKSRSTAWAPVNCSEFHKPELVIMENVREFLTWKLYPMWLECWKALGYSLSVHVLDAADFGVPQNRTRVFWIGTRSKKPLSLSFEKQAPVPVLNILDLDKGRWSKVNKPNRAKSTLERVSNGRKRFGELFVMPYYTNGSGKTGRDINRPVGTVTTHDRWAIVKGDEMRMFSVEEYRKAMSFPEDTILPPRKDDACLFLGNATCPGKVEKVITAAVNAA